MRDFVRLLHSLVKGELVLFQLVHGIKQVGLRPSSMKSHKDILSTSGRYEKSTRMDFVRLVRSRAIGGHLISVRYEESSMRDFVRPVRSHVKGGLVLVCPVREIKLAGLRPFGTKSCERRACPHMFGTRNRAGYTSSIHYEVTRMESLSSSL